MSILTCHQSSDEQNMHLKQPMIQYVTVSSSINMVQFELSLCDFIGKVRVSYDEWGLGMSSSQELIGRDSPTYSLGLTSIEVMPPSLGLTETEAAPPLLGLGINCSLRHHQFHLFNTST